MIWTQKISHHLKLEEYILNSIFNVDICLFTFLVLSDVTYPDHLRFDS